MQILKTTRVSNYNLDFMVICLAENVIIKTFKASRIRGPHRKLNNKPSKMDKSLNRGMFNKFESCKICVAGYQCDNGDFDFCIAEHELSVIKICSDEGRDDVNN